MSSIDQYMPCVCGSGKKFKFCKCGATEHATELEKILRLIEGDQDLAALDRINSQLSKHPSAAWLYAVKAEVLLRLGEHQPLVEVSRRFIKLKPDNPLALIYCSIATGMAGDPIRDQARYLLSGIAECRQVYPSVIGIAIQLLVLRLLEEANPALIGFWGLMQSQSAMRSNQPPAIQQPEVHWLCKTSSKLIESPKGASWLERMDEVNALASAFRFEQVEKKLSSILRDFPNQPGPLSALLNAQVAQLDAAGAIATAQKLAACSELSAEDRAYFRVLAWEYENAPLTVDNYIRYAEIDSDEALIESLSSMSELVADDGDEVRQLFANIIDDEVPAKRVFRIFDYQNRDGVEYRNELGEIAVFGRQTDRPPRVLLLSVDYPPFHPIRDKVLSRISIAKELDPLDANRRQYTEILARNVIDPSSNPPWEPVDVRGRRLVDEFLHLPFKVLDGLTPLEAAQRPDLKETLTALLIHLEGSPTIVAPLTAILEIYRQLQIDRPLRPIKTNSEGKLLISDMLYALRIDYQSLADDQLEQLFHTFRIYGHYRLQMELGHLLLARPDAVKDPELELIVRASIMHLTPILTEKLEHGTRVIELRKAFELPIGEVVITQALVLGRLGREEEGNAFLTKMINEYPEDPELMAFARQMYSQYAMAAQRTGASPTHPGSSSWADSGESPMDGGLVLPGANKSASSESKLWLPGT